MRQQRSPAQRQARRGCQGGLTARERLRGMPLRTDAAPVWRAAWCEWSGGTPSPPKSEPHPRPRAARANQI